jgi:ubiquitin-protein ligase
MRLKYPFVTQKVNDGYVAVATDEGADEFKAIVRLNEVGKRIFELLAEEQTEESIVAELKKTYRDEDGKIERSVHEFVEQLDSEGILAKPRLTENTRTT